MVSVKKSPPPLWPENFQAPPAAPLPPRHSGPTQSLQAPPARHHPHESGMLSKEEREVLEAERRQDREEQERLNQSEMTSEERRDRERFARIQAEDVRIFDAILQDRKYASVTVKPMAAAACRARSPDSETLSRQILLPSEAPASAVGPEAAMGPEASAVAVSDSEAPRTFNRCAHLVLDQPMPLAVTVVQPLAAAMAEETASCSEHLIRSYDTSTEVLETMAEETENDNVIDLGPVDSYVDNDFEAARGGLCLSAQSQHVDMPSWASIVPSPTPSEASEADTGNDFPNPGAFLTMPQYLKMPTYVPATPFYPPKKDRPDRFWEPIPDSGVKESPFDWVYRWLKRAREPQQILDHTAAIGARSHAGYVFATVVAEILENMTDRAKRPRGVQKKRLLADPQQKIGFIMPSAMNGLQPAYYMPGAGVCFDVNWDNVSAFTTVLFELPIRTIGGAVDGTWKTVQLWGQF